MAIEIPPFSQNLRIDNLFNPRRISRGNDLSLMREYGRYNQGFKYPQGNLIRVANDVANQGQALPPEQPKNVVYQPSLGDMAREIAYGEKVHGVDLNKRSITPYQQGQLALGRERIDATRDAAEDRLAVAQQNANTMAKRAEIADYAARNRGIKLVTNKVTGTTQAIGPDARIIRDFGKTQLTDQELSDIQQEREEALVSARGTEERNNIGARGEQERQNITARGDQDRRTRSMPRSRFETIRDAEGKITDVRQTTEEYTDPNASQNQGAWMYGKDGKRYLVPFARTDEAQSKGYTFSR